MLWGLFLALIALLLVLDLGVLHRRAEVLPLSKAAAWSVFWMALGVGFAGPVYLIYETGWQGRPSGEGVEAASTYVTAYFLEKSLSVDNLFVIAVVFDTFGVPRAYRHRVLYWGILGALALRAVMILGGIWLLARFEWLFLPFGAWLVYAGVKLLRSHGEAEETPTEGRFSGWLRRVLPLAEGDHGARFAVRTDAGWRLTTLALVLLVVEWTDVVFAVDSVPAVLGVTDDPFLAFSSNAFAVLGLRALFFVLDALLGRFDKLPKALALVLMFIGVKMLLHGYVHVPNAVSLAVLAVLLLGGVIASRPLRDSDPEEA